MGSWVIKSLKVTGIVLVLLRSSLPANFLSPLPFAFRCFRFRWLGNKNSSRVTPIKVTHKTAKNNRRSNKTCMGRTCNTL